MYSAFVTVTPRIAILGLVVVDGLQHDSQIACIVIYPEFGRVERFGNGDFNWDLCAEDVSRRQGQRNCDPLSSHTGAGSARSGHRGGYALAVLVGRNVWNKKPQRSDPRA